MILASIPLNRSAGSPIARIASSFEISTSIVSRLTFPGAALINPSTLSSLVVVVGDGDQRLQARDDDMVEAVGDQREQRLLGLMQCRARDLAHTLRGWRLDQLRPAAQDQLVTHALWSALTRGDILRQPGRQCLG